MLSTAIEVMLVLGVVLLLLVPFVHWLTARWSAAVEGRSWPRGAELMGDPVAGLLQPLADLLKWLSKDEARRPGSIPVARRVAPIFVVTVPLLALAVIPFGGRYDLGRFELDLVIADPDWSGAWLLVTVLFSLYGMVLAGWGGATTSAVLGGVRRASQLISFPVVLMLSMVGVFMVYGSLSLQQIALGQDAVFAPLAGLGARWPGEWSAMLEVILLPRWGVFTQPLAFVLVLFCVSIDSATRPFDAPHAGSELAAGPVGGQSGAELLLFVLGAHLRTILVACVLVSFFFGAWSIPFLPTGTVVANIGAFYGEGFGTLVCIALHVGVFILKVLVVTAAGIGLAVSLPRLRVDQTMRICWTHILPLALVNVALTAWILTLRTEMS